MKAYQEAKKKRIDNLGRPKLQQQLTLMVVVIVSILTIIFSVWNTVTMQKASEENVQDYISDINSQMAETLNTEQADTKNILSGIVNSISVFYSDGIETTSTNEYIANYLKETTVSTKFNYLFLLKEDGSRLTSDTVPDYISKQISSDMEVVQEVNGTNNSAAYVLEDNILYAQCIYANNEKIGTLIGGVSTSSVMHIMNVNVYKDKINFCVSSYTSDKVLIKSGSEILEEAGKYIKNHDDLQEKMRTDFQEVNSGMVECDNLSDGNNYYMSYTPVEGEDWMLVVLVPTNLFSSIYLSYMQRALLVNLLSVILFGLLLLFILQSTTKYKRGLEKYLYEDDLTGGSNLMDFQLRYESLKKSCNPCDYTIVMLDIRDFKLVNESMGFTVGDQVLKEVYETIHQLLDSNKREFVCRTEMDHYMVCLNENTQEGVQRRIDEITEEVNKNGIIQQVLYHLEFKSGACIIKDKYVDITIIEECARVARQNTNKENPNACSFYTEEMHDKIFDNRMLDRMAEKSIEDHDFKVYFQPKVSLSKHEVEGAEALVRWQHPTKGFLPPNSFIPILEETGRIQDLDKYVFEEVCRWLEDRQASNKKMFPVSINLSRRHFWKQNFLDEYMNILNKYNVDHKYIEFEITETVFVEEEKHNKIKEGISQMHQNGFKCSVDDFGVGYSSLSLVHDMDVDILKFDRSFFTNLEDEKAQKIVKNLINMATDLQLGTVIEGIETESQIDFLKDENCDIIQGYYYSPPLPEDEFNQWVDDFNKQ